MNLPLPLRLQQEITQQLQVLQERSPPLLTPVDRERLYQVIWQLADPLPFQVHSWLAVVTAQYVLPLWEARIPLFMQTASGQYPATEFSDYDLPQRLLPACADFLRGTISREDFSVILDQAYYWMGGLGEIPGLYLNEYYAADVAYRAAGVIRNDWKNSTELFRLIFAGKTTLPATDDDFGMVNGDTASAAVKAYVWSTDGGAEMGKKHPGLRVDRNPERCREFWTWWLTDALPQAWQLAQP